MERPGTALISSVAIHAAVVGAVVAAMTLGLNDRPPRQIVNAVPVSIVSQTLELAGPADAPSEAPAADTAAAPPIEAPEPTPPEPTPVPTPRPPEKAVAPRPTVQPRPTPPPTRPPETKRRPVAPPREDTLDLSALAAERPNRSTNRTPARPSGQQSSGTQGQSRGPLVTAMFDQVYPNWNPPCQTEGAAGLRIQMDVTLATDGRITAGPTLVGARNDPVWRAVAGGAQQALIRSAPFDVPAGFTGGVYRPSFNMERACRNR